MYDLMTGTRKCDTVLKIFRKEEKTVKKRILFISLAVVLALSVGLIGCGDGVTREPSAKIIIGMSRSVSGSLAVVHDSAFLPAYSAYVAKINAAPTNGITVDGTKFLVDVDVKNDNSTVGGLTSHTTTLINQVAAGTVHTIFGPCSTHMIDVMAPIVDEADCVLMTAEGGGTFLIQEPGPPPYPGLIHSMPNVFLHLSFSDWYQLPVLATLLDEAHKDAYPGQNATAWIIYQDDSHGLEYNYVAGKFFAAANIDVLGSTECVNSPVYDYEGVVSDIAAEDPDIVCCFVYPTENQELVKAAIGLQENFDAWIGGPGACFGIFGTFMAGLSAEKVEGVLTFAVGNNETSGPGNLIPDATITMEELFNDIIAGGVWTWQDAWGHPLYWATLEIWQNAVETVGYIQDGGFMIDQDDLQAELAGYNSTPNGVNTVLGKTWYNMFTPNGGGILAYECHTGEIGQWQDGYIQIVGPEKALVEIPPVGPGPPPTYESHNLTDVLPNYRPTSTFDYPKDNWPTP